MIQQHPIVIIGAGSITAALLKRDGHEVLLLERQKFSRFSIGESLLSHCLDFIEQARMLNAVEAAGFQSKHGAAFAWDETNLYVADPKRRLKVLVELCAG